MQPRYRPSGTGLKSAMVAGPAGRRSVASGTVDAMPSITVADFAGLKPGPEPIQSNPGTYL